MHKKVAAVTVALAVPAFLWPPKPARAATTDFAPALSAPAPVAPYRTRQHEAARWQAVHLEAPGAARQCAV